MSYLIEYDKRAGKYEVREDTDLFPWILTFLGIIILMVCCFWPEGTNRLREVLIPGEDTVTLQAFSAMTDDLRSGASIFDALEVFCRTVIHEK